MTTTGLTRFDHTLGSTEAVPRCECEHDPGPVQCPDDATFAVTVVCADRACDNATGVYLLCQECLDMWQRGVAPGAPRLRVRRL
jgi:hypothetical protein